MHGSKCGDGIPERRLGHGHLEHTQVPEGLIDMEHLGEFAHRPGSEEIKALLFFSTVKDKKSRG
jgi:hypothetical protein